MKRIGSHFTVVFEFAYGVFGICVNTMKYICPDCNLAALAEILKRGRSM